MSAIGGKNGMPRNRSLADLAASVSPVWQYVIGGFVGMAMVGAVFAVASCVVG